MYDATPDDERRTPSDGPQEPAEEPSSAGEQAMAYEPAEPAYEPEPEPAYESEPAYEPEGPDAAGAAGARPLGLVTQPTGHAEVDTQLRRLADADHLAVFGHLDVYEDVHRGLRSTLTALDQHDPGS